MKPFLEIKKKLILGLGIVLLLSYPAALSYDIFNYVTTAKVAFHYFENPYIIMPIEFLGDSSLLFTHAANKIALYGPLWTVLSSIPYLLSLGNYLIAVYLFKIFVVSFYLGIVWIISKVTKNMGSTLYFALSPLVLIETFVSGHNDVIMMFFALVSVYFLRNKKIATSLFFLVLSILIKYSTIFLIPIFVYFIVRIINKKEVDWEKFYFWSSLSMLLIFFLSTLREEIYPWYAIWPLTFITLSNKKWLKELFVFFTFGLMLRYVPYMWIGTHFGPTPILKVLLTFAPAACFIVYKLVRGELSFRS